MAKTILKPFSFLYGAIVRARHSLYEKGFFKTHDLHVKTISIGNITVGGTGKTPMVALVARILAESGEKVCVLTRGYGRENPKRRVLVSDGEKVLADAKQSGDEPFELANKLIGISAVIADANRSEAGNWARESFGVTAFVLDDAFQHFQIQRDLDIVLVDATNPFGGGEILPSGILREDLANLERADAVVVTRANLVSDKQISDLKLQITKLCPYEKIFVSRNRISNITGLQEFAAKNQKRKTKKENQLVTRHSSLVTQKSLAFCALGNPENFFEQLRRENFKLISTKTFRDHHRYTQKDVDDLQLLAAEKGAEILLTTAKDAVKLAELKFDVPCFVVESELIFDDEKNFRHLILK